MILLGEICIRFQLKIISTFMQQSVTVIMTDVSHYFGHKSTCASYTGNNHPQTFVATNLYSWSVLFLVWDFVYMWFERIQWITAFIFWKLKLMVHSMSSYSVGSLLSYINIVHVFVIMCQQNWKESVVKSHTLLMHVILIYWNIGKVLSYGFLMPHDYKN